MSYSVKEPGRTLSSPTRRAQLTRDLDLRANPPTAARQQHSSAAAAVALNSHVAAHGAVKGKHIRVGFDDTLCDATATHPQPREARHAGESHVP